MIMSLLTPEQAFAAANQIFVDVREKWETSEGYIENSILYPMSGVDYTKFVDFLCDNNLEQAPIVVYCRRGIRSQDFIERASAAAHDMGVNLDLANLVGGIELWKESSLPYLVS